MKKRGIIYLFAASALIVSFLHVSEIPHFTGASIAFAEEDWKTEFDDVCSKTQHSMKFSIEELKDLVARCDKLKPIIENLENRSEKKIYGRKLKMCHDLFLFVLQSKETQ